MQSPNIHIPGKFPNVFLFATPRGGSTWLMEIIASQNGFKYCNEPLNLRNNHVLKRLSVIGINNWEDIYSIDKGNNIKKYSVWKNGYLPYKNPNPLPSSKTDYRLISTRLVFKIIHGGEDRINWFREQFNGIIIFLLRHPIPTSLSRDVYPRLKSFINSDYQRLLTEKELSLARNIAIHGNKLEKGVLSWCMQNIVPLRGETSKWLITTYEQLVIEPLPVLKLLATKLSLPTTKKMVDNIEKPSSAIYKSDTETKNFFIEKRKQKHWLISKWHKNVSINDEKNVMEILDVFESDLYKAGSDLPRIDLIYK